MQAASKIVQGSSVAEAAESVGIKRRQLYNDLKQPEIQAALASLFAANAERFRTLFQRSLNVIEDALEANYVALGSPAPVETDIPDRALRLKAVAELRHLIDLGQRFAAPSGQPTDGALPQWEEFQAVVMTYRRSQAQPS